MLPPHCRVFGLSEISAVVLSFLVWRKGNREAGLAL